jgi:hypothetical protein
MTATKPIKDSIRIAKQDTSTASTQGFMPISEIHDNTLILKNGGLRSILKVNSINFNLKSEEEQRSILYSYQGFLNTLSFPIQILIKSKKLEIDTYLEKLKKIGEKQPDQLLQKQTFEYIQYIEKLVEYADIMEKNFYLIIPMDPYRSSTPNPIQKLFEKLKGKDTFAEIQKRKLEFNELKKQLSSRINVAKAGLENCGLKVDILKDSEIIELLYKSYNPITSRQQKLGDLEEIQINQNNF